MFAERNLLNENGRRLDGTAHVDRNLSPGSPVNYGVDLTYAGQRSSGSVDVNHVRHQGTNVYTASHIESRNQGTQQDSQSIISRILARERGHHMGNA